MRTRFLFLALALGLVAALPAARPANLPLGDLKLVAEQSVPSTELMFASRNGNRNGVRSSRNTSYSPYGYYGGIFFGASRHARANAGELVEVELR